jgi:hypothetical protein
MANIVISFNTNAAQDSKLAKLLAKTNADNASQTPPGPEYASVEAWLRFVVIETVKGYVLAQQRAEKDEVSAAFDAADSAAQAAARTALGLP